MRRKFPKDYVESRGREIEAFVRDAHAINELWRTSRGVKFKCPRMPPRFERGES